MVVAHATGRPSRRHTKRPAADSEAKGSCFPAFREENLKINLDLTSGEILSPLPSERLANSPSRTQYYL